MAAYRRVDDLRSPAGRLPVHRDQLRAQRSVSSMGSLYLTFYAGSGPQSNTWFPGPTRVLNPNNISIGSAVFPTLTSVTDRQTNR